MSVIPKLASSLNRRDEIPNQELAKAIASKNDKNAIKELVENLHNKDKNIQSDCIKVLDEIGLLKPGLVAPYTDDLLALLSHKNNRLQWGAMAVLDNITSEIPDKIYKALSQVIDSADKGTVITNDRCVSILIKLCSVKKYEEDAFSLLNERLKICPTNQLPMYAENAVPIINSKNKTQFLKTLSSRTKEIEKESKRKRVEKVISRLNK